MIRWAVGVTKRIVGSGVNVVKSTLGGPQGNFEEAVAAIANAELLMEKQGTVKWSNPRIEKRKIELDDIPTGLY